MRLSRTDAVTAGDLAVIWKTNCADFYGVPWTTVAAFLAENYASLFNGGYSTQYAAPSATGFSVSISDTGSNIHLILTPGAGYADGTIVLPDSTNCVDKQEVLVNCTQAVTTLVVNGNGATAVTGEPATLAANAFFRLKYDLLTSTWYRVG